MKKWSFAVFAALAVSVFGCLGKAPSVDGADYAVDFASSAGPSDVQSLEQNLELDLETDVRLQQVTSISYDLFVDRALTDSDIALIENEFNQAPLVCEYCRYGNGCPAIRMDKPACQ